MNGLPDVTPDEDDDAEEDDPDETLDYLSVAKCVANGLVDPESREDGCTDAEFYREATKLKRRQIEPPASPEEPNFLIAPRRATSFN